MNAPGHVALVGAATGRLNTLASRIRRATGARVSVVVQPRRIARLFAAGANLDVLLLDVDIPAPDILQEALARHPRLTTLVALSESHRQERIALLEAGCSHILPAPYDSAEVEVLVRRALAQRPAQPDAAERRARNLHAIHEVATTINSALDIAQVLEGTCRAAVELFDVDHSGLVRFDATYTSGYVAAEYPALGMHNLLIPVNGVVAEERLIGHQQPLILPTLTLADKAALGPVADIFRRYDIRSVLIVPVLYQGRVIGSFSLDAIGRERTFDADEIECCRILAAQVAVAIEKTHLLQETRRRAEQLDALRQTALALTSQLNRDALLTDIVRRAVELLGGRSGGVYVYQPERDVLVLMADHNHPEELHGQTLRRGEGMAGRLIDGTTPFIIIADYQQWPGRAEVFQDVCPFGAVLAVPLCWQDQPIGVLYVDDQIGRQFTTEDAYQLRLFADHAAIALTNARLVAEKSAAATVNERLAAEYATQKEHWQGLITHAPIGIIINDANGTMVTVNQHAAQLLDSPPERLLQHNVSGIYVHSGEAHAIGAELQQSGGVLIRETALRKRNGDSVPIRLAATLLRDSQGVPVGTIGYFEDLRSLRGAESRLRLLVQISALIAEATDMNAVLGQLAAHLVALLDVTCCRICLWDPARRVLQVAAAAAVPRDDSSFAWAPSVGEQFAVDAWVYPLQQAETAPMLLRSNVPAHHAWVATLSRQFGVFPDLQSVLVVPLPGHAGAVGLVELGEQRAWERSALAPADQEILGTIAGQIGRLVQRLQMTQMIDYQRQRLAHLETLVRTLHSSQEVTRLHQEVLQLAIDLFNGNCGALLLYHPHQHELEVVAISGLPRQSLGQSSPATHSLIGRVAHSGRSQALPQAAGAHLGAAPIDAQSLHCAVVVPLVQAGWVRAVLLVGDKRDQHALMTIDCEMVERFAMHAALALHTAQMLDTEQRTFRQLDLLHRLSEFLQTNQRLDRMCHAVLTAVTLNDGLRFNRAVLCLLNERGDMLQGHAGIGHFESEDALADWAALRSDRTDAFRSYLEALEKEPMVLTPLAHAIRHFHMPMDPEATDALSVAMHERRCMMLEGGADGGRGQLPPTFIAQYQPPPTLVVAPLVGRGRVLGVIVADNKFNRAPITHEDRERLMTFARTAAVAIENLQLLVQTEQARRLVSTFLAAGPPPATPDHPEQVLQHAADYIQQTIRAIWVSMILIDETGESYRMISTRDGIFDGAHLVRSGGVSHQVMQRGEPMMFENTDLYREQLNPTIFRHGVTAAACLPLKRQDQSIGVVWIHWAEPRTFAQTELEALQLYLQQVAVSYANIQRMRVLEQIRAAAETVAQAADTATVLRAIAEHARTLSRADVAIVWSYDQAQSAFILAESVAVGLSDSAWKQVQQMLPRPEGTAAAALEQGWLGVTNVLSERGRTLIGSQARRTLELIGARSFQAIGLCAGQEQFGVIYLCYRRPYSFSEDDRRAGAIFAQFAALTLRQSRLQGRVALAAQAEQAANETMRVVARVSALEQMDLAVRQIVESIQRLLGCDTVVLYVYEPQRQRLYHEPVAVGVRQTKAMARVGTHQGGNTLVSLVVSSSQAIWLDDVHDHPRFAASYFVNVEGILSTAALPLRFGEQAVGALFVGYRTPHTFRPEEKDLLHVLADQAATTIRNDQLYQQGQRMINTLHMIQGAGRLVAGALGRAGSHTTRLQETLTQIVALALRLVSDESRPHCFSHVALVYGRTLRFVAAHPPQHLAGLQQHPGDIDLDGPQVGVTGRAVLTGQPLRVDDVYRNSDYLPYDPNVRAELAVPIRVGRQVIGVINVEHPQEGAFSDEDERALSALADYAATAIQNARLIDRSSMLKEMSDAAARSTEPNLLLRAVCQKLELDHVLGKPDSRTVASIWLYSAREHTLLFEPHWSESYEDVDQHGGQRTAYRLELGEGICGWVAQQRQSANIGDVLAHAGPPIYRNILPKRFATHSEICVPICYGEGAAEELIGVLDIQSELRYAFDNEDRVFLETLAAQLAVIIRKSQEYHELRTTRATLAARTALVWVSMVTNHWRHKIEQDAIYIRTAVSMIKVLYKQALPAEVIGHLDTIYQHAHQITHQKMTPPLSVEEGVVVIPIDDLVRERVAQLWELGRYGEVIAPPVLRLTADAQVRVSPEWLRRALDLLIDNAVEAIETARKSDATRVCALTIATRREKHQVWMAIQDTGLGIPPEIRQQLFQRQVERSNRQRGLGIGLLMVEMIAETYSGEVWIANTGPEGTTMVLALPVASYE